MNGESVSKSSSYLRGHEPFTLQAPRSGADEPLLEKPEAARQDWQSLFLVDSEQSADILWGDMGRIYYLIRKDDLQKRAFENIWMGVPLLLNRGEFGWGRAALQSWISDLVSVHEPISSRSALPGKHGRKYGPCDAEHFVGTSAVIWGVLAAGELTNVWMAESNPLPFRRDSATLRRFRGARQGGSAAVGPIPGGTRPWRWVAETRGEAPSSFGTEKNAAMRRRRRAPFLCAKTTQPWGRLRGSQCFHDQFEFVHLSPIKAPPLQNSNHAAIAWSGRSPQNDLLTRLLEAEVANDRLTHEEILAFFRLLMAH
jgi:hypothetical protein